MMEGHAKVKKLCERFDLDDPAVKLTLKYYVDAIVMPKSARLNRSSTRYQCQLLIANVDSPHGMSCRRHLTTLMEETGDETH